MFHRLAELLVIFVAVASAALATPAECRVKLTGCDALLCNCWFKSQLECEQTVPVRMRCTGLSQQHEALGQIAPTGWDIGPKTAIELGGCGWLEEYVPNQPDPVHCLWNQAGSRCQCVPFVGEWTETRTRCDRVWNLQQCGS